MIRVVLVVALVAAACGTQGGQVSAPPLVTAPSTSTPPESSGTPGAPATTPDGTPPEASIEPAELRQVDCPPEIASGIVACGVATVPLDHTDPAAGTTVITIATMTGTRADSLTPAAVLQGGPGGSSSELAGWFPQQPFTQVFVDQRGTGFQGTDLDCPEIDTALVRYLELDSAAAADAYDDAATACARRLADDPVFVSADSVTHARDVAAVMAALGYERWVAYGVSYGTTIALELLRAEPAGLAGVVLDGVYPPELDVDAGLVRSAVNSVSELDAACLADVECSSFTADVDGLLDRLIAELDVSPITVEVRGRDLGLDDDVTVVLDGARLAEFSFILLYSESQFRFLPGALAGIAEGDDAAARWLARNGARVLLSAQGANDEGTYYAVQCRDRLPFTEGPPVDTVSFAALATAPLTGACDAWDRDPAPASAGEPVTSDLPALLLSGRFDPITPPAFAEEVATRLGDATVVEQDGRGHGIWYGDDCIAGIVARFVADPGGELDTSCAAAGPEVDWARP